MIPTRSISVVRAVGTMAFALASPVLLCPMSSRAEDSPPVLPTASDVLAGYRQNVGVFETLRVTGRRIEAPAKNMELQLRVAGTAEEEIAHYMRPRAYFQQFWTDHIGFQLRVPNTEQAGHPADHEFRFPETPLTEESFTREFASILVFTFDGDPSSGVRVWNCMRGKTPSGAIRIAMPPHNEDCHLPPLAGNVGVLGFVMHPIDAFLLEDSGALQVVRSETVGGRPTVVLEKDVEDPEYTRRWSGGKDDLKVFWRYRGWVDPGRGFLPLRIEKVFVFKGGDGRVIEDPWGLGPSHLIEARDIRQVEGGGYYPFAVADSEFGVDVTSNEDLPMPREIVDAGKAVKRRSALHQEIRWEVQDVRAGVDMDGLFALGFPSTTVYYDHRTSEPMGRSYASVEQAMAAAAAGPPAAVSRIPAGVWLVALNLALVVAIAAVLIYRAVRRRASQ